jgi:hypothetical protein
MRSLKLIFWLGAFTLGGTALADLQWKARPSVEEEFKGSAVVIVGKVINAKDVPDAGAFIKGTFYTIRVTGVLKGSPSKSVELYSENSSGRFPMKVGASHLIFAHEAVFEGIEGQRLTIDASGNSGTVKRSKKALARAKQSAATHRHAVPPGADNRGNK